MWIKESCIEAADNCWITLMSLMGTSFPLGAGIFSMSRGTVEYSWGQSLRYRSSGSSLFSIRRHSMLRMLGLYRSYFISIPISQLTHSIYSPTTAYSAFFTLCPFFCSTLLTKGFNLMYCIVLSISLKHINVQQRIFYFTVTCMYYMCKSIIINFCFEFTLNLKLAHYKWVDWANIKYLEYFPCTICTADCNFICNIRLL